MSHRLSVRLPDDLARGVDAFALRSGKTKSEVVRYALRQAGICVKQGAQNRTALFERAARLRARQIRIVDAAALIREVRDGQRASDA